MIVENDKVILNDKAEIDALKKMVQTLDDRRFFNNLITAVDIQCYENPQADSIKFLRKIAKDCNEIFNEKIKREVLEKAHDFYCVLGDREKLLHAEV